MFNGRWCVLGTGHDSYRVPRRGKTTLLNRLLTGDHGLRVAVLVNDFGSLNIDADLVVGVNEREVVSLANGCVCCTIRDDLVDAVANVLDRPERPSTWCWRQVAWPTRPASP